MKLVLAALAAAFAATTSAYAADVVVEEAPVAIEQAAVFSWTGAYIGGFGAYATGEREYTDEGIFGGDEDFELDSDGGLFGAQIGYDHQFGSFVVGIVADIAYSTNEADETIEIPGFADIEGSSELEYLGTVRGRVGFAADRALFYAHGGLAYGEVSYEVESGGVEIDVDDEDRTGYVVGAGLEYAFTDNISGLVEYSFVDLGDEDITGDFIGSGDISEELDLHAIKAGVNFRF